MKNGVPSSNFKYLRLIDSAPVLWRKDEKETWKGLKRFEMEKIKIT
jgi:hypothetical protein